MGIFYINKCKSAMAIHNYLILFRQFPTDAY